MEQANRNDTAGNKRKLGDDMISVKLAEVPSYLHKSELFQTYKDNEDADIDEIISVPSGCLHKSDIVRNEHDVVGLLHTLRYWGVVEVPENVILFYATSNTPKPLFDDVFNYFPTVRLLQSISLLPRHKWLTETARHGDLSLMQFLHEKGMKWQGGECGMAARAGHLHCLHYAFKHRRGHHQRPWREWCPCREAFQKGHLHCLQYAYENNCCSRYWNHTSVNDLDCRYTTAECLECVLDRRVKSNRPLSEATRDRFVLDAIRLCSIPSVEMLRGMGWQWDDPSLKYDLQRNNVAVMAAIQTGDPQILVHLVRGGCRLQGNEANALAQKGRTDSLVLLLDRGQRLSAASFRRVVLTGEMELVRTLLERNVCAEESGAVEALAEAGQVELLRLALQLKYKPTFRACRRGAQQGDMAVLRCSAEGGCEVNEKVCTAAAAGGHLRCLQYAHGRGGACTEEAVLAALRGDHVSCLRYLHEKCCCALTTKAVMTAVDCDAAQCLQYLHKHGAAWDEAVGARATKMGSAQCLNYFNEHLSHTTLKA
jgi:hypothetical protein